MKTLTFATLATPNSVTQTILFIESLRRFGGDYADSPLLVLVPEHAGGLPQEVMNRLESQDIHLLQFELPAALRDFPLAAVAGGAGAAESAAVGSPLLAWMLPDTLALNPPDVLELQEGTDFAYRPVHHTLVGSIYDRPPDAFWSALYRACGTSPQRLLPMQTCLRDHIIRPYFNAGLLVVRPILGLLRAWNSQFERLAHDPEFKRFYEQDPRYAVFMHQAVLSALIPALLAPERLHELPESVNYPLHLHAEYPQPYRPEKISDLVTCRYEDFEVLQDALDAGLFADSQLSWLKEKLAI